MPESFGASWPQKIFVPHLAKRISEGTRLGPLKGLLLLSMSMILTYQYRESLSFSKKDCQGRKLLRGNQSCYFLR